MASLNEKSPSVTNVLTITRPTPSRQPSSTAQPALSTIDDVSSTHSLSPTRSSRSEKEYTMSHTTAHPAADSKVNITSSDCDLELGVTPMTTSTRNPLTRGKGGVDPYPCRATQKRLRREQKLARAKCACWANMSKNHRKVLIVIGVLVFIAVVTTMAILITKATGGGVWGKHGQGNAAIS